MISSYHLQALFVNESYTQTSCRKTCGILLSCRKGQRKTIVSSLLCANAPLSNCQPLNTFLASGFRLSREVSLFYKIPPFASKPFSLCRRGLPPGGAWLPHWLGRPSEPPSGTLRSRENAPLMEVPGYKPRPLHRTRNFVDLNDFPRSRHRKNLPEIY